MSAVMMNCWAVALGSRVGWEPGTLGGGGEPALCASEVATRRYTQLLGGLGVCGLPLPPRYQWDTTSRPPRVQRRPAAELRPPLFSDKFLEIL